MSTNIIRSSTGEHIEGIFSFLYSVDTGYEFYPAGQAANKGSTADGA
jgi:hypothetical protein